MPADDQQPLCPRLGPPPTDTPEEASVQGEAYRVRQLSNDVNASVEFFLKLHEDMRRRGDDEVFESVSNDKAVIDERFETLEVAARRLLVVAKAKRTSPPLPKVTAEYLKIAAMCIVRLRKYYDVLQTFLVMRLAGIMDAGAGPHGGSNSAAAADYAMLIRGMFTSLEEAREGGKGEEEGEGDDVIDFHSPLQPSSKQVLPVHELQSIGDIEMALASVCQTLNEERARLWAAEGIAEDGVPRAAQEGAWQGFAKRWIVPLGCNSCMTATPQYPTSALLEQLVVELAELRNAAMRLPRPEPRLLRLAEATLLGLDPHNVRSGAEARYFRDELSRLEEAIADAAATPAPTAAAMHATLSTIKKTLNTLHRLLLYRFQCLQDSPAAQEYQELFTLCETLLDEVLTAERRAAGR